MVKWFEIQISVGVCWFYVHLVSQRPVFLNIKQNIREGNRVFSLCFQRKVNCGCNELMCCENLSKFSKPCDQLLSVSSSYISIDQKLGFKSTMVRTFFSNLFINKFAITGDKELPIGAPLLKGYGGAHFRAGRLWARFL